jgi:hypothetical protein
VTIVKDENPTIGTLRELVVVMRGSSAALFKQNEQLYVPGFPSSIGPVNILFTTRYLSRKPDVTIPGQLWIEIRGNARTLDEALVPFANASLNILPVLALSANAAVGEPEIELGFDDTAGITERDYFQSYVPPERDVAHVARGIDVPATEALLGAIGMHPDSERLLRGANKYRIALQSWRLGREALSLAHLWMAVEAITKAKVRAECKARGVSGQADLAVQLGVDLKQLDGVVRRDLLLNGDAEAYKKSREASDGFEHGFLGYDKIRELSRDVRHRMAGYVRTAILELCGLDRAVLDRLTSNPFDKPLGHWPIAKYLRGKLVSSGEELAAPGNAYPFIKWDSTIRTATWEGGKLNIQIGENLTGELAQGITFRPRSVEAWQPD